jgi:hemerythrin superfamily protein
MAKSKAKGRSQGRSQGRSSGRSAAGARGASRQKDAIALLKEDHREAEALFEQFEKAKDDERKQMLANQVCNALKVHTMIEEEIFYPAFLAATEDLELHHEAEVEHNGAKKLIAEIEASGPDDEYYDAKVKVLSEMIKHHVKEEEQPGGMFAEARKSDMDLAALGERMAARKMEIMEEMPMDVPPGRGGRRAGLQERAPSGRHR